MLEEGPRLKLVKSEGAGAGAGAGARRLGRLEGPDSPCLELEDVFLWLWNSSYLGRGTQALGAYGPFQTKGRQVDPRPPLLPTAPKEPPLFGFRKTHQAPFPSSRTLQECLGEILQGCFTHGEH